MGKVVIVTGASGGIGSVIAARFGARGDRVAVNYRTGRGRAERVAGAIETAGGEAMLCEADIRSFSEVEAMAMAVLTRWGRIDVLVNNAGGGSRWLDRPSVPLIETSEESWNMTIDVNLKGAFHCIKAVAPQMMKQREGHILNIASGSGIAGIKGMSAYSAAKAGLIGLGKTAARELGEHNVRVNTVCPGMILHQRLTERGGVTDEMVQNFKGKDAVLGRTGSAEEVADFIIHVSEMQNVSGQLLNIDSRILF